MTELDTARLHVTIHLQQQATVTFEAAELWPMHGVYARFGSDLPSFAEEVTRRLQTDGFIGFSVSAGKITVIPLGAVKRIDFAASGTSGGSGTAAGPAPS